MAKGFLKKTVNFEFKGTIDEVDGVVSFVYENKEEGFNSVPVEEVLKDLLGHQFYMKATDEI